MQNHFTQQEIILFTNTRFCAKIGSKQQQPGLPLTGTDHEQLEDACWKGIVPEVLPEIATCASSNNTGLWEINRATNFIDLQYADSPRRAVKELSLNPYLFLGNCRLN